MIVLQERYGVSPPVINRAANLDKSRSKMYNAGKREISDPMTKIDWSKYPAIPGFDSLKWKREIQEKFRDCIIKECIYPALA